MCRDFGISHSHFMGGAARWTETDRLKAIEFERWRRTVCQNCGTRATEWVDEAGVELDPPPYQPVDDKCLGCEGLELAREADRDNRAGVRWALVPHDVFMAHERALADADG